MFRARALPAVKQVLTISALWALAACGEQRPTEPSVVGPLREGSPSPGAALVECPTSETKSKTSIIGDAGGTIAIGGTSVLFPAGALPGLTTVTLTIPASRYVEIKIETDGANSFPVNLQPIVTIDYVRCERSDVLSKPLTAWYIDSQTKDLLEKMESVDDKLTRSVTFPTTHFSGYAIAF